MKNFASVPDVVNVLQVEVPDSKLEAVEYCILRVSAAIRIETKQLICLVENDEIALSGPPKSDRLSLPELPVNEIVSVYEDGEALTVEDDYELGDAGILYRISAYWAHGHKNITVTYHHGHDQTPEIVNAICAQAAARLYQAGLTAAENNAITGIQSKSLGDYSVSFGTSSNPADGAMGVSAARLLLLSEKDMLSEFKI